MRNIQKLIAILSIIIISSCTSDELLITEEKPTVGAQKNGGGTASGKNKATPKYSNEYLIVQYKPSTSDFEKTAIRFTHGVTNYEICHCDDQNIEKWSFGGVIAVEPKKVIIEDDIDSESTTGLLDVDYEFVFGLDLDSPFLGSDADVGYESYIKTGNPGITIAILDTGIATGLTVFNEGSSAVDFLYDASATAASYESSGWDFVNTDANAYDDDEGKHGSIIAYQINEKLSMHNIAHQILPVKVSNSDGNASYFNFLCGTKYALERANIVHMSMGWYDDGFGDHINSIFANIVSVHPDKFVITSAGNNGTDNDDYIHYPSSYPHDNIIAVASANEVLSKVSDFSNYSSVSVDFYAQGEGIGFYDVTVQGTSFAAPQVTIEVARLLSPPMSIAPDGIVSKLIDSGVSVTTDFTEIIVFDEETETDVTVHKPVKYAKIIIPFLD